MRMVLVVLAIMALGPAASVPAEEEPVAVSPATLRFSTPPGMPPCVKAAAVKGDSTKGAAVILAKTTVGCRVPRHWHTAGEQLMIVSGAGTIEMKDGKPSDADRRVHVAPQTSCPPGDVHVGVHDVRRVRRGVRHPPHRPGREGRAGAEDEGRGWMGLGRLRWATGRHS